MGEFKRNKYKFATMSVITEKGKEIDELRGNEVSLFTKELFLYKVLLRDLIGHFPTQKDRNLILNIAYYIVEESELFEKIEERRELPLGRIAKKTKISRGFLEIWQDYIIAYMLIISNPNFTYIQDYIKIEINEDNDSNVIALNNKDEVSHRGIVIQTNKKSAIILTNYGQFFKIKKSEMVELGHEIHGLEKKSVFRYKFHIVFGILFILLLCGAAYRSYVKVSSTIIFTCTSQVKLEVNSSNKVIYTYSSTEKGDAMISKVKPLDKDIDKCLKEFIIYAKENEMIPKDGFQIVISGKALGYGELDETDEYIVDNNISAEINNAGNLHNIHESVKIKKGEGK